MKASALVVVVSIVAAACGNGAGPGSGGASPTPSCPSGADTVKVQTPTVTRSNTVLSGCQTLSPSDEFDAVSGGSATGSFRGDATCNFNQLPSATGGPLKTAQVVTRYPAGVVFDMTNADAHCTIGSTMPPELCGQATLLSTGQLLQVQASCNNDPVVDVKVYRGSATLRLDKVIPPKLIPLAANQAAHADAATGLSSIGPASFTTDEASLFEAQREAFLGRVSSGDPTALLLLTSFPPSAAILAPNAVKAQFGQNYGNVSAMCDSLNLSAVFYPDDPAGLVPQLSGSVCRAKTAQVYGVTVYVPTRLVIGKGQYFQDSGGKLVASQIFSTPVIVEHGKATPLFSWNGSGDLGSPLSSGSPQSSPTGRGVYVARFVYSLPPDNTPHVALVAFSLGGAAFPAIG